MIGCPPAGFHRLPVALLAMLLAVPALVGADRGHDPPDEAAAVVRANAFEPSRVDVAPEGTVTWQVLENDHTIVADDGRFDFRGEQGGTLSAGSTRAFTVGRDDEVIRYYCSVHGGPGGQGMSGVIVVGHPEPPAADTPVVRVPDDAGSIAEAVATVPAWGRVEIAPGTYPIDEPIVVERPGITVAGAGRSSSDVRIEHGRDLPRSAFELRGSHQTLTNLTVGPMRTHAIVVTGANAAALVSLAVDGGGSVSNGVLIEDTTAAAVLDTSIDGARRAGVRVEPCSACGVLIARTEVTDSLVGVLATGARGVRVVDSTFAHNSAGIVARSSTERPVTIEIRNSVLRDNDERTSLPERSDPARRLATGAGVWLSGVAASTVVGNTLEGHSYGVVLAGGLATTTTIADNSIDGSADADLAWDGFGRDVCFRGNGTATTSDPPDIEGLYPCDRPTVGVPYPLVDARLLLHAYA